MGKIIELQSYRGRISREQIPVPSREELIINRFKEAEMQYVGFVNVLFYSGKKASMMRRVLNRLGRKLDEQNEQTVRTLFDSRFPFHDGLAMRAQATLFASRHHAEQLSNKNLPFGVRVFIQERNDTLNNRIREYREQYSSEA